MAVAISATSNTSALTQLVDQMRAMSEFKFARDTTIVNIARDLLAQGLRLSDWLGDGSSGNIFALVDRSNKRVKVLKVFDGRTTCQVTDALSRAMKISHSSIVTPECLYLEKSPHVNSVDFIRAEILPYVDGETLWECVTSDWTFSEMLDYMQSALEGLKCFADSNLSHDDLHDANLMVTSDKKAKIIDFDLVRSKNQSVKDEDNLLENIKSKIPFSKISKVDAEYLLFCFKILEQDIEKIRYYDPACSEIDKSKRKIDLMIDCIQNWRELAAKGLLGV